MEAKIRTDFWNETSIQKWKNRYADHTYKLLIFFLANIAFYIIFGMKFMTIMNLIPTTIIILIHTSKIKHDQQTRKQQQEEEQYIREYNQQKELEQEEIRCQTTQNKQSKD